MQQDLFKRVMERAKIRGIDGPAALAAALGVLPQNVNNWKNRGVPARMHQKLAEVLNWSVDELLGKSPVASKSETFWPFGVPFADYMDLTAKQKAELAEIVEDRIARYKAKGRRPMKSGGRRAA